MMPIKPPHKFYIKLLPTLLIGLLVALDSFAQSLPPPPPPPQSQSSGSLKLYIEENGRLKKQKDALDLENAALKQALQAEKQKSGQLQTSLDQYQPSIDARDRQLAELKAELNRVNQKMARQDLLAAILAWVIVMLLVGIFAYFQRKTLGKLLRTVLEMQQARSKSARQTAVRQKAARQRMQQPQSQGKPEENAIKPEEIFNRLYGKR